MAHATAWHRAGLSLLGALALYLAGIGVHAALPAVHVGFVVAGCVAVVHAGACLVPLRFAVPCSYALAAGAYLGIGALVGLAVPAFPLLLGVLLWPYLAFAWLIACPLGACPFEV